ncbi:hypothetical protein E8E12_005943 [Didymella heteroderae]|uniref:Uncharacterized protein n=1 Tax=Didymella heteroderae TaxID=1769908 RepID=A0A9P4WLS7_9PLEO|nr:hypothetical protein E8E12_005943 [Didymella heteroderae]
MGMASVPAAQRPTSPPAPCVNESIERSSSALPPHNPTVDTRSSMPEAVLGSANTTAASETTEKTPTAVVSPIPHALTTAVEGCSDLEAEEAIELNQPAIPEADITLGIVVTANQNVHEKAIAEHTLAAEREESYHHAAAELPTADEIEAIVVVKACEPKHEIPTPTRLEHLTATTQEQVITPAAGPDEEKDDQQTHDDVQTSYVNGREAIAEDGEDGEDDSFGEDEDTAVESKSHERNPVEPSRSVPPHMHPAFRTPTIPHSNTSDARPHWPAPIPRPARGYYPPVSHQPSRPLLNYDELQRAKSELRKARSDLDFERKVNVEMRKTVGTEKQASVGAAMADTLNDLLQKQADALAEKSRVQDKERDLQYREQKVTQIETYLANGQKQLKWQLEQQGIRAMSKVEEANLWHQVELQMKHRLSEIEGKIEIQVERLRHQEAAQEIREQQYKILIRNALENELREQLAQDMQAKITDVRDTKAAYENGLTDDKKSKDTKSSEDEHKQDFLKGYAACYRALTNLHKVRTGKTAVDSPDIAFLFDPTHPENPYNVGLDIGRTVAVLAKIDNAVEEVPVASHEQARLVKQYPSIQTREAQQGHQIQQEQPHLRQLCIYTFHFRGTNPKATSKAPRAGTMGRMVDGVYAGRRTIRYEEDFEDEPPAPDLIDLY